MASLKTRVDFLATEEGKDFKRALVGMTTDTTYNTASSYSANSMQYPDNLIPFVDRHMNYISTHPKLEADKYLANLKLMTRVR